MITMAQYLYGAKNSSQSGQPVADRLAYQCAIGLGWRRVSVRCPALLCGRSYLQPISLLRTGFWKISHKGESHERFRASCRTHLHHLRNPQPNLPAPLARSADLQGDPQPPGAPAQPGMRLGIRPHRPAQSGRRLPQISHRVACVVKPIAEREEAANGPVVRPSGQLLFTANPPWLVWGTEETLSEVD